MGSLYDNSGEDIYARRDIEKRRKHAMAMKKKRKRQILKRKIMLFTGAAAILVASLGLTAVVRKNNTASGSSLNPKETQQVAIDANADAANDDNIDKKDEKKLKKIMPDSEKNPSARSGAEPYVFTNCYSTHPGYYGKSYQSWTTGTSVWCMMGVYEGIMGVKRDYEGLMVDPCFPAEWEEAEVTRHFRGADYHIVVHNPGHLENGRGTVRVDGKICPDSVLPDFRDGKRHEVEVLLG